MSSKLPKPEPIQIRSMSVFHCNWLLNLAYVAAKRCSDLAAGRQDSNGIEEKTEDAISCILLAAAAAEAFINEIGYVLAEHVRESGEAADQRLVAAIKQHLFCNLLAWLFGRISRFPC